MKIEGPIAWVRRILKDWRRQRNVLPNRLTQVLAGLAYVLSVIVALALWFRLNGWDLPWHGP